MGSEVANGYQAAKASHIFRDLVSATGHLSLTETDVTVQFQRRAHNPLLVAAGLAETDVRIPWLGGKRLRLVFGP